MTSTTGCRRGDLALVRFVFADEEGAKRRPVLILSTDAYHESRNDVIVAAVTSNVARRLPGDHPLQDWREAGLPKPSLVAAIVRTIKGHMMERRLGTVTVRDLRSVERALRSVMGL